ncbi:pre-mRNA-splicing factor ATP-dependent RNA helicase PRP16 [Russula ochroleuca]|uniref:Pre-mRNA-splicing factor ATP-dependent RNA helicase PRP16 n=1 Tax=Russula ochroleuca TaxID=152965 RepID=A0A9P5N5Z8_9AGAM|nr:pre-mRNA-splicing factor ATP-dependent RNA helicase PRP16 [Russula ochroleuca]
MLLWEFLTEPDLAGYSALIIDEDIAQFWPELKLLISSATMDAEKFSKYFDKSLVVDIHYMPQPEANYLHAAITTIFQIHTTQPKGDILGQDKIEAAQENLTETARALGNKIAELIVCPMYAMNIAAMSITIDSIVFVIDSGFVKQSSYNSHVCRYEGALMPLERLQTPRDIIITTHQTISSSLMRKHNPHTWKYKHADS